MARKCHSLEVRYPSFSFWRIYVTIPSLIFNYIFIIFFVLFLLRAIGLYVRDTEYPFIVVVSSVVSMVLYIVVFVILIIKPIFS
jgi:hypothetical protein